MVGRRVRRTVERFRFHDYRAPPFLEGEGCRCIQSLLLFIPAGCRSTEGGSTAERGIKTECLQLSRMAGLDEKECPPGGER